MNDFSLEIAGLPQTRQELVVNKLREAILRGYLKPGQRLDLDEITNLLGVSKSPVREAIRTLAAEGLVQVVPHRGVSIPELSDQEIEEIYTIRSVLEGMAARVAVPNLDKPALEQLEQVLVEMETTTDSEEWVALNRKFHECIYVAANRPRLLALIDQLRNTSAPYIRQFIRSPEYIQEAANDHRAIYMACVNGDETAAERLTQKHLMDVCAGIVKHDGALKATDEKPVIV
jgi:DNA-binding GntR family transcriptional regulator